MRSFVKPFLLLILVLSTVCFVFYSCEKNPGNPVPLTSVDVYIYLKNPSSQALTVPGGSIYVDGGVKGIIVYRVSENEFVAFDRNCTYNPSDKNAIVRFQNTGSIIAIDTSCGSKFSIIDGSVQHGPATVGLRQYRATYDGVSVVHVTSN